MRSLNFFDLPNPSSGPMVLGFTQPITEMGTKESMVVVVGGGGKAQPVHKADNVTAICEPNV
jgi:hypothetical protein